MNDTFAGSANEFLEIGRRIQLILNKHLHLVAPQSGDALAAKAISPATVRERQAKMRVIA